MADRLPSEFHPDAFGELSELNDGTTGNDMARRVVLSRNTSPLSLEFRKLRISGLSLDKEHARFLVHRSRSQSL